MELRCPSLRIDRPPETDAVLRGMGRTEAVGFSPSGRRLAIALFDRNAIVIVDVVAVCESGRAVSIRLGAAVTVTCASLRAAHGVSFIDDMTLVVANRLGNVVVLELPPAGSTGNVAVEHVRHLVLGTENPPMNPGSASAAVTSAGLVDVVACYVTPPTLVRFVLDRVDGLQVICSDELLSAGLDLPDGVTHSRACDWIAVSNHETGEVLMYRNDPMLGPRSRPAGSLRGMRYPHGVAFACDDQYVLVTDAGAPHLHVFVNDGGWEGVRTSDAVFTMMDDSVFALGHYDEREGGLKGIAYHAHTGIVVTTCQHQPLEFYLLQNLVGRSVERDPGVGTRSSTAEDLAGRALSMWAIDRMSGAAADRRLAAARMAHERQLLEVGRQMRLLKARDHAMQAEVARLRGSALQASITAGY